MSVLAQLALTFAVLSLLSIGGANATIPEIHRQVVDIHHWMDDGTFAQLIALGQAAPGPNVLVVSMIGWHLAGLAGMVVATLAIVLPSSLFALVLGRLLAHYGTTNGVSLTRRALAPVAIGFMLASGYVMARASFAGALTLLIVVSSAAMILLTRVSPLWSILGGALVGIVSRRLHLIG